MSGPRGANNDRVRGRGGIAHNGQRLHTPDQAIARALLDGAQLDSGARREIDPLFIVAAEEPAARLAVRWAEAMGRRMSARVDGQYQRGWCSWYHYFHEITEEALRANLKSLAAMRKDFPIDVVQLDDGFQSALGDWDTTNAKFPGGLKKVADEIRAVGFKAGIWAAPFLAARDSRLMREHPDWFIIHEESGWPVQAGFNQNWTASNDPFAYALDPSNPAFRAHLERLFARLTREFGYSYLKLDFLYAAAAEGRRNDLHMTRGETLRCGLEAIRAGAGEDAFILGCGCPLGAAVGIVDGMRIGPDVAPFWGDTTGGMGEPSTLHALEAIVARGFMHRRLWLNDPDCLMLRARETHLSADERAALAAAIAVSGGMLLVSDDMALLDRESAKLFRTVAEIGEKIDGDTAREPALAIDLMAEGGVIGLVKTSDGGGAIAMVLNRGNEPATIDPAEVALPAGEAGGARSRDGRNRGRVRHNPSPAALRADHPGPALIGSTQRRVRSCRHRVRRGGRREIFRTVRMAPAWSSSRDRALRSPHPPFPPRTAPPSIRRIRHR